MKPFATLTDPTYTPPARTGQITKWLLSLIRDERDLPFVYLTLQISFTLLPLAFLLYMPFVTGWVWGAVAIAYQVLNNFVFKGPFGLMLHCTSHRPFFKKKYQALNYYLPWIIGPFFGQSPETYFVHHIGMHHAENNLDDDDSCTMHYQRDSLRDFLRYFIRFFFLVIYNLSQYFVRKNRRKLRGRLLRGEFSFILMCILLSFINWQATLVVFIIPFLISRLIMMLGNWAQHSFVCASDPGNEYKNSITCINTNYNHKCWNDGYHISHHEKPTLHWTEHPIHFQQNIDRYAANDAIVFDGIHFLHVWFYLMLKRYDLLAKSFVNIGNRFGSDADVIHFLQQRTKKI